MMKKILISVTAAYFLSTSLVAAQQTFSNDCRDLGYKTPYNECIKSGGNPLFCPNYSVDNPLTLCLSRSCRGYALTEDDLNAQASDERKMRDHVEILETCETGIIGGDKTTYYRVGKCKDTSLYQNGICDVGCLAERYPYDTHQGDQAGDMRDCIDAAGIHYGYETCNAGWEGGWQDKKTGKCKLSSCSIKNFPYLKDPNINYNRGETLTCRVGGNIYYRYTQVDSAGNPLTENACGVDNKYTLSNAVCYQKCEFNNCTATVKHETLSGVNFQYNDWACQQQTSDCRVGDEASINGVSVGVITHMPDDDTNRVNIMALTPFYKNHTNIEYAATDTILPNAGGVGQTKDKNGKYNSAAILAYKIEQNKTANPPYEFPLFEAINDYAPEGCSGACGKGEWYFYASGELMQIFKNRYVLYNKTSSVMGTSLLSGYWASSTGKYGIYTGALSFDGSSWNGTMFVEARRDGNIRAYPMMSFTLK